MLLDAASLRVLFVDGECPLQENTPSQEKPLEIGKTGAKNSCLIMVFTHFILTHTISTAGP